MRLLIRLLGLAGLGGFIYFGSFDAISSPYLLYGFAALITSSYAIKRTTAKTIRSSRTGFTLYRVNGKVRIRRKADYARIAALEKEFGIGPVEETPAPKRILPPPKPSDAATSARPPLSCRCCRCSQARSDARDDGVQLHHIALRYSGGYAVLPSM